LNLGHLRMALVVPILIILSLARAANVPCGANEVYYGNDTLIECVNITSGSRRVFVDLLANKMLFPGYYCPWIALNNELWYPGFVSMLRQAATSINAVTQQSYFTNGGPTPDNVLTDWVDVLPNPYNHLIYASFEWPINGVEARQFFYYENRTNATAVSFLNVSLPCETACGFFFSFSSFNLRY